MLTEADITLDDGRTLHVYDRPAVEHPNGALAVVWHHGTPNIGAPPEPLFEAADRLGIRWVGYDRPGYGGSTPRPGRDAASAAGDVTAVVDALGIERFSVMSHSGGGPPALACAALLPERVIAAALLAGLAPFEAEGLDWFAGMTPSGVASLRAAVRGRAAKEAHEAAATDGDPGFTAADERALEGPWSWFGGIVGAALAHGPGGLIDDDLSYVAPWGFDPAHVTAQTLFVHGGADRMVPASHSAWLGRRCATAELWLRPDDGHISVLGAAEEALAWLRRQADRR